MPIMIKPIKACTNAELTAIVRSTSPNGHFAAEREDAIIEMSARVAHKALKNAKLEGMRAAGDKMERHAANTFASTLSVREGDAFLAGYYTELRRLDY
jgi:hypothetical protein